METTEEIKQTNKFQSRRFILCIWSAILVTGIVIGSYIRDNYEMISVALALIAIIGTFVGIESVNKKFKYQDKEQG